MPAAAMAARSATPRAIGTVSRRRLTHRLPHLGRIVLRPGNEHGPLMTLPGGEGYPNAGHELALRIEFLPLELPGHLPSAGGNRRRRRVTHRHDHSSSTYLRNDPRPADQTVETVGPVVVNIPAELIPRPVHPLKPVQLNRAGLPAAGTNKHQVL